MPDKKLTPVARRLRRHSTDAERLLWTRIRSAQLGTKFVRQFPIGAHVVDFASRSAHLVVELDGGQHSADTDQARTEAMEMFGYRVIRFWKHEVNDNLEGVLQSIANELRLNR